MGRGVQMEYLDFAETLAKSAGSLIMKRMEGPIAAEEKSSSFDVVTEVDKEVEQWIRESINNHFPEHHFLGEEEAYVSGQSLQSVLSEAVKKPFLWIVDPIDGTSNFVQGIPGFTVSIALAVKGELTVGAVYDPCAGELFSAVKGGGAFLNGRPLHVSVKERLNESVVATGFPSDMPSRMAVYSGLGNLLQQCRTIRSLGSAARHLAYVAAGRLDGFWENGLKCWDMAAGVLLVQEAGGHVTDCSGGQYQLAASDIVSSNGRIHDLLLDCVE